MSGATARDAVRAAPPVLVAIEALPVPAAVIDVAATVPELVAANAALAELLGVEVSRLAHRPAGQVIVGGLATEAGLLVALLEGEAAQAHAFLAAGDGSLVPVRAAVAPASGDGGERLVTFTVERDDDPGAPLWLEDLAAALPVAVAVSRVGAHVAFVNDRFAGLCRLPADRLIGTGWLTAVRDHHRDRLLDAVTRALEGEECSAELALVTGVEVLATFRPAARRAGPAGFVAVFDVRSGATIEAAIDEAELAEDLAADLARGDVTVAYQPIVDGAGTVVALEALVRWEHRRRGLIPAGVVNDLAERRDLLEPLLDHVLHRSLADHERIRQACDGSAPRYVAVNVSPSQLHERTVGAVAAALDDLGVPGDRLCIELIESAAVTDPAGAAEALAPLAARDVRLALDDFGTGFSSISLLRALPVTLVKVDRLFVEHIVTSTVDRHLVAGVVRMATSLGAEVVAEGVETDEQDTVVRELGCRYRQGWLHGRAMSPEDVVALVRRQHLGGTGNAGAERDG